MIFGEESETLEFKRSTGEKREAVEDIAAMLNKSGGGEFAITSFSRRQVVRLMIELKADISAIAGSGKGKYARYSMRN
jgi:hypothetical protein